MGGHPLSRWDFTCKLSDNFLKGGVRSKMLKIKLVVSEVQGGREGVRKDQPKSDTCPCDLF